MGMRRLLTSLFVLLFCASLPVLGQKQKPRNLVTFDFKPFHFGYSVGVSPINFYLKPQDNNSLLKVRSGMIINLNLITNLRIRNNLDLRFLPGIQFASRSIEIEDRPTKELKEFSIEGVFIDLPVLIKYRSDRVNNYAPYLIAGVNPRIDLLGSHLATGFQKSARLSKAFDVYPELGFGIDFYLQKVKIATELKFSVGLLDVHLPTEADIDTATNIDYTYYNQRLSSMFSRMVIFAIHVE